LARKQSPAQLARVSIPDALGSSVPNRAKLLELAQVDEPEQALLTRLVINKLRNLMSAQKVQRLVVNTGLHTSDVREFIDDNGELQARVTAELIDLLGLKPSRSAGISSGGGPQTINVTFRERDPLHEATVIDVTPRKRSPHTQ
jgi:hypothetical protein